MSDMISRAEIISTFAELGKTGRYGGMCEWVIEIVEQLPPIQPKRGRWILVTDNNGQHFECNHCGEWRYHQEQNFCGNCGVNMEEVTT